MDKKVTLCKECVMSNKNNKVSNVKYSYVGYYTVLKVPEDGICLKCGNELTNTNITIDELGVLYNISHDPQFIESMISLKDTDPIEYQLKMSQFKSQLAQTQMIEDNSDNKAKCPICNSTNLSKISAVKKVTKVGLFGIFGAGDIGKTYKCNNCGSRF